MLSIMSLSECYLLEILVVVDVLPELEIVSLKTMPDWQKRRITTTWNYEIKGLLAQKFS